MSDEAGKECRACRLMVNPWVIGLLAVTELVLGFLLLSFPFVLGASAVWVCGFVLGVGGLVRLVQSLIRSADRWWNLLAALVYICLGVVMVALPVFSLELATLIIGVALLCGGLLRLILALTTQGQPGAVWRALNGIVSVVLGLLVLVGWPGSSLWLIGTIIAVEMIFSGWTLLFLTLAPSGSAPQEE